MRFSLNIPDTKFTKYLLDTNIIDEIFHQNPIALAHYNRVDRRLVWIPVVVYVEKVRGWSNKIHTDYKQGDSKAERKAVDTYYLFQQYCLFMGRHFILPYAETATAQMSRSGKIGTVDRRIAACAMTYGFKVATRNVSDFAELLAPEQIVDWTIDPNFGQE